MSASSDSLKKKVCVTVFLDELFEEVKEEEEEEEERRNPRQVSEVTESVAKIPEKSFKEPSRLDLGNDEKVTVSPNADIEQSQIQLRPRKHRRESKFSKNRYDSFKNELSKYGYGSCVKMENETREPADSAVSDSDFDLDEFLGLDKWAVEKSKSSFTELSECDLTEDSFLSINPTVSITMISCPNDSNSSPPEKSHTYIESCVVYCNKSTQFEVIDREAKNVGDDVSFEKETQKEEEEVLAWKKTHKQIQLILAEAKSKYREREACEGDRIRHYDLRSILEECVGAEGRLPSRNIRARSNASTECNESDMQDLSDSYTCVFPHSKQPLQSPEVKKVWASTKRNIWNDGFESDLSEADCANYAKDIGILPLQNDSLLCYTLCLKCEESELSEKAEKKSEVIAEKSASQSKSGSMSRDSSFESIKSRSSREAELVIQAVSQLGERTLIGNVVKTEQEKRTGNRNEGSLSHESLKNGSTVEGRNKNFAEGDAIAKPLNHASKLFLDLDPKEKVLVCDEILKHVGEPKGLCNEIIVNRAEIELHSQNEPQLKAEILNASPQATATSEVIAEVFFNQKTESLEKSMTDAESEMVFAESENFCESEDFFCSRYSVGGAPSYQKKSLKKDVCVVEFEDKLSRSKILRRMKTVEILGDSSLNDMKNISTEVILICENISNNEVSMEAWQSSTSTLKSISEMKQCYLKDSKDSAMYLIEIPLHFTQAKKKRSSESDHLFKATDSE